MDTGGHDCWAVFHRFVDADLQPSYLKAGCARGTALQTARRVLCVPAMTDCFKTVQTSSATTVGIEASFADATLFTRATSSLARATTIHGVHARRVRSARCHGALRGPYPSRSAARRPNPRPSARRQPQRGRGGLRKTRIRSPSCTAVADIALYRCAKAREELRLWPAGGHGLSGGRLLPGETGAPRRSTAFAGRLTQFIQPFRACVRACYSPFDIRPERDKPAR